ncbi:nucleotidyltransferase [candidate division WWE3 bacterium CG_4_9_14_3_um_filter_43_9]|uniref:Nucleotidyltransferase n=2 Tax=Katanobacteria TaxID=422282 RepID=A0A2M7WY61_UNCKA|nr:MAG: nucleotidyltransferase [candidate division WWE3 bacterium CG_4_9_14_3_um_filter_43_9]
MAKKKTLDRKIRNQVYKYLAFIKRNGFRIEKAIVFGSFAKGNPKPWSDIDLCLVSPRFKGDNLEQAAQLAFLAHKIGLFIEPHLFHPHDLKEKFDPLADEIKKYGIEIKEENRSGKSSH